MKKVLTGRLIDTSQSPVISTTKHLKTTSYAYKRYLADGIEDSIQINIQDDTVDRQKVFHYQTLNLKHPILSKDQPQCGRDNQTAASMSGDLFWGDCDSGGYDSSHTRDQTLTDNNSSNLLDVSVTRDDTNISSNNDNMEYYDITLSQKIWLKECPIYH